MRMVNYETFETPFERVSESGNLIVECKGRRESEVLIKLGSNWGPLSKWKCKGRRGPTFQAQLLSPPYPRSPRATLLPPNRLVRFFYLPRCPLLSAPPPPFALLTLFRLFKSNWK